MDKVLGQAKASALPPAGFAIDSKADIESGSMTPRKR